MPATKSYRTEQAEKRAAKAKASTKYTFLPVGMDIWDGPATLKLGDTVVKIQPAGCPRNGTMGCCYVGHPETGEFIGMVLVASLVKAQVQR